jgi:hypothetical protein
LLLQIAEPKQKDTIYSAKISSRLEKELINSWKSSLDPSLYLKIYVNKVYQSGFSGMTPSGSFT